jgi:UDP-N-acetyl-D-mannosaminuronic acid dehydrogenase
MGINVYDVRTGITSLKGEGITRAMLFPGAGVGGHCLSKDTYLLELGVKDAVLPLDYPKKKSSLFLSARVVNDFMPEHVAHLTRDALKRAGKDVPKAEIALLGWAFTKNSADVRESPARVCWILLSRAGARVKIHDPYVREDGEIPISNSLHEAVQDVDAIVIVTGHDEYLHLNPSELKVVMRQAHPVIVDGRNIVSADEFIVNGFIYKGIGRGDVNEHPLR